MILRKMISTKELLGFIENIDKKLNKELILIAVGGTAMTLLGLKESTKDIDFCTLTQKDKEIFLKQAKNSKFKIDVWYDGYIFALQLPKDYIKKSKEFKKYKYLNLRILNPIDIVLTKTARLNQRDVEDIEALAKHINKKTLIKRFNEIKESIPGSEKQYEENFKLILKEFFSK